MGGADAALGVMVSRLLAHMVPSASSRHALTSLMSCIAAIVADRFLSVVYVAH